MISVALHHSAWQHLPKQNTDSLVYQPGCVCVCKPHVSSLWPLKHKMLVRLVLRSHAEKVKKSTCGRWCGHFKDHPWLDFRYCPEYKMMLIIRCVEAVTNFHRLNWANQTLSRLTNCNRHPINALETKKICGKNIPNFLWACIKCTSNHL